MYQNAYNQYRTTAVTTANPGKLLLMLYDGLAGFLRQADQAIVQKDIQQAHSFLVKSQEIITELMCTLNMDYEISQSLYQLYDYMKRRLVEANTRKDREAVAEVLGLVTGLRSAWAEAAETVSGRTAAR